MSADSNIRALPSANDTPAGLVGTLQRRMPNIKSLFVVIEYQGDEPNSILHTYQSRGQIAYAAMAAMLYAHESLEREE